MPKLPDTGMSEVPGVRPRDFVATKPLGVPMTITQHTERLCRAEADIVVRQLTGEYHHQHGVDNNEHFDDFVRKLAWQIGCDNTRDFRDYLVEALEAFENLMDIYWGDQPHELRDRYEANLNTAVNGALDAAGARSGVINRSGEQRPLALQAAA